MTVSFQHVALLATILLTAALAEDTADLAEFTNFSGARKSLHTVVPAYPRSALRDRIEGDVEVCFDVNRDGKTSRISVRRSSNRVFERPAMQAVRQSTYVKLPVDAELSGIKTCRTFRFRLDPVGITDLDAAAESVEAKP
ncbi:MAG: energy transducer TonB [Gammaproteobacteria bacterium]|nr:energy transducer TonB [Gammaproteobacteria bacterium]MDH5322835.1 energy transducer TonB [Gammaproteobacteria bacterium]